VSRRGVSVEDDGRWVFNRLAADYAARPGYPAELVARLVELAGGRGARVAELGAGTGLLSLALAAAGAAVQAVEPARAMLLVLQGAAERGRPAGAALVRGPDLGNSQRGGPGTVTPVHATGEATGLPDGAFDLVVLADALHWVDAARAGREAARLLAPAGVLAVVTPRLGDTPFLRELQALLATANPKARPGAPPVGLLFGAARLPPPCRACYRSEDQLDADRLAAVLRSLSLVGPALGPAGLAELLAHAQALAVRHGGAAWPRELDLDWSRRPPG
jgi:SAM-dependent methyltransferase